MTDPDPHGHEPTDVSVGAVARFAIGLTLSTIAVLGLMWFVFDRFAASEAARSPRPGPMAAADPRTEPPEPRLQITPLPDLKKFRDDEDALLASYAWIDPGKGVVRIPVDRAMELVAREGLPARSAK
ncbi:MAG: hypothetical protein ACRD96_17795 [Bryobacteraceae bacterium]